ncbi:hypothetical protein U2060_15225, partial [Listeria monocytogenes]|uniref:hypothetical protein n=1 Tax=Listeria monocytogenes TaxID=1639 RepID=UPI002FDC0ACD
LTNSGALRRATSNSIRQATWERIMLVVDLPYAKRHNEGLDGMPQRTFIGQTNELTKIQNEFVTKYFDKIWH